MAHFQEPVSPWKAWMRKSDTIRSVASRMDRLDSDRLRERLRRIQEGTLDSRDGLQVTRSFWIMEKTASEYFKQNHPGAHLRDPELPEPVRPIAHCGMGIGAVEHLGFDRDVVWNGILSCAHPDYRWFACESIGAMLGVYQPGPFLMMAKGMSGFGVIPMAKLVQPDLADYRTRFSPEEWILISHGFGRLLYFRNHSVGKAVSAARQAKTFDFLSCVRGIAFAMAMVNSRDVGKVLAREYEFPDPAVADAFERGLVYALVFWEWMSPGFLDRFTNGAGSFRRRSTRARAEMAEAHRSGAPRAFDLFD